jgi:translocation and assembly module TamB
MGLTNGVLDIENFQLALGKSLIKGGGQARILDKNLALIKDPDIQLALPGTSVFLEDFFPDITGRISLEGQVNGRPSNLAGHLNVDGDSLGFGGQKIDGFSSKMRIQGRVLEIDQMELTVSPGSMIRAEGQVVPMDQTFDIRVDSKNFDLACLDLFEKNGGDGGRLSLDLSARGPFKDPVVEGHLGIRELVLLQEKHRSMDLRVELKNRRLGIKGNLGPTVEGAYHLDTKAFTAALDMEGLNLSPYLKLMDQSQFSGSITGRVRAEGRADQLEQVRASADLSEIRVAFDDKPFIRVKDVDLVLENSQYHLSSTRIDLLEKGSLRVKGDGNFKGGLDFEILGDIPLEVINPLVEEIESATGLIEMSASINGTIEAPRVQGDFHFKGLGMGVDGLEQNFKNVDGHIKLLPDQIEIIGLKGYLDQGRFDLGGSVGLKKWAAKKIDLKFTAHQLNLDIPDVIELSLNCDLSFAGTDQASELKGEIALLEGRYYKDVELDLLAAATRKTREVAPLREKSLPLFLQTIGLNVYISRREALLVDNNMAYLAVSPDLTIKGTAAAPLLAGRAQVDSGYITFQRVEFEVKKGVIDFINPYKIEPTIDIEGETEIRDWTITLIVSGTPDNLAFKFSSSPSEQHGDILSLIAFGKTTRELRGADNGGGFATGEILASMVADSLGKGLKESTGLDYLEINTTGKDASGSGGVDVTVGKELSRQISVKYGVVVRNGETVQRVTTDYKFLENLLMSGYQDTDGQFGGELKYRLEFR